MTGRRLAPALAALLLAAPAAAQMAPQQGPSIMHRPGGPMMHGRDHAPPVRHRHVMQNGLPGNYMTAQNPLPADPDIIDRGAALYAEHCARCHGADGTGGGPDAADLAPPPADLTHTLAMPIGFDGFLFWTVSEGGVELGTGMPAFADALSAEERWSVIHYLRAAFGPQGQ